MAMDTLTDEVIYALYPDYECIANWASGLEEKTIDFYVEESFSGELGLEDEQINGVKEFYTENPSESYYGKKFLKNPLYSHSLNIDPLETFTEKNIEGLNFLKIFGDGANGYRLAYAREKHSIEFNPNNGSSILRIEDVPFGMPFDEVSLRTSIENKMAAPVRANYDFKGWYMDPSFKAPADLSTGSMPNSDLALFAKWEGREYVVNFYEEFGSKDPLMTLKLNSGDYVRNPNTYIRGMGYSGIGTFMGWKWVIPGTSKLVNYAFDTPVTRDINIYGDWKKGGFSVIYSLGSNTGTVPVDPNSYSLEDEVRVLPGDGVDLYSFSHRFSAWRDSDNGTLFYPGDIISIVADLFLTPVILSGEFPVKVVYEPNFAGEVAPVNQYVNKYRSFHVMGKIFNRPGYTFLGWGDSPGDTGPSYAPGQRHEALGVSADSKTFYGVWKKDSAPPIPPTPPPSTPSTTPTPPTPPIPPTPPRKLNKEDHFAYVQGYPDGSVRRRLILPGRKLLPYSLGCWISSIGRP